MDDSADARGDLDLIEELVAQLLEDVISQRTERNSTSCS